MPATKKLDLNEALEDSPQTQALAETIEKSIDPLKDFVLQLKETCQTLHTHQSKVTETMNVLSNILLSAKDKAFGEKDSVVNGALHQLGKHVAELHSWQEMLCAQLDHAVVQQLDSFIANDMTRLTSLKEAFHTARGDHEQAVVKYNKTSKKKETERSRFDANSELFAVRRRFHQSSLQYYTELNNLQHRKKFCLLDPMLAFMHSQLAYFKMGHEILTDEVGKFLTVLNVEIQKERSEHDKSVKEQKLLVNELEQQSSQLCIPDPDPSDPFVEYIPANLQLHSKSGYLLYRQQGAKWERIYFYTKGHLLYWQQVNRAAEVMLDLTTEGVNASTTDIDDRRYVFQIIAIHLQNQQQVAHKALYFQAESAKSRDEWIATIINIVSAKRKQPEIGNLLEFETRERSGSDLIKIERERVRTFVQSHSSLKSYSITAEPAPTTHQMATKKQKPHPPIEPPARPPPPIKKRTRPPPPPPFVGGASVDDEANPVQRLLESVDSENLSIPSSGGYSRYYVVRYLGSLEVEKNKGVSVVKDAIRRIVAARALKNIMAVFYVNMLISHKGISLTEVKSGQLTEEFKMKDISYCAKHPENDKLFGVIARKWENNNFKIICYVFESETSGKEICQSVIEAIRTAVGIVTGKGPSSPPPTIEQPVLGHPQVSIPHSSSGIYSVPYGSPPDSSLPYSGNVPYGSPSDSSLPYSGNVPYGSPPDSNLPYSGNIPYGSPSDSSLPYSGNVPYGSPLYSTIPEYAVIKKPAITKSLSTGSFREGGVKMDLPEDTTASNGMSVVKEQNEPLIDLMSNESPSVDLQLQQQFNWEKGEESPHSNQLATPLNTTVTVPPNTPAPTPENSLGAGQLPSETVLLDNMSQYVDPLIELQRATDIATTNTLSTVDQPTTDQQ